MKKCFKCQKELPLSDFYKHKQMGDGYLGKCKTCTKKDVRKHRIENIDRIRDYDRKRGNRQTKAYRDNWKVRYPNKYKAITLVGSAISCKRLFKEPCEVCGAEEKVHAHHDDYSKPLNVRWLCAAHHREWHVKNGEGRNGK